MIKIRNADGAVIRTDPDLAGVTLRAMTRPVHRIDVWPTTPGGATVAVEWEDGATCTCSMPDPVGALAWARFTCPDGLRVHGAGA